MAFYFIFVGMVDGVAVSCVRTQRYAFFLSFPPAGRGHLPLAKRAATLERRGEDKEWGRGDLM